jgi:tellurite resistance protein
MTMTTPADPRSTPINDAPTAFAAIALAAVSWDGVLTQAGTRALRHNLDYRHPFSDYGDERMVRMMDQLLFQLRRLGAQHLMVEAAAALNPDQRATAFAVAAEIMRSDGRLQEDERNILSNLGSVLELDPEFQAGLIAAMGVLHADLV